VGGLLGFDPPFWTKHIENKKDDKIKDLKRFHNISFKFKYFRDVIGYVGNDKWIVLLSENKKSVYVLDKKLETCLGRIDLKGEVIDMAINKNYLFIGYEKAIEIIYLNTLKQIYYEEVEEFSGFKSDDSGVNVSFCLNNTRIESEILIDNVSLEVKLDIPKNNKGKKYNLKLFFNLLTTLTEHNYYVRSVSFSPDGKFLASGSSDKAIKIWEARNWNSSIATLTQHENFVNSVSFSPIINGKYYLASGSADGTIKIWNVQNWKVIETLEEHKGPVNSVSFSPDGKLLASGSADGTIKIWKVGDWKPSIATLKGHMSYVYSVSFSPDGEFLASGSYKEIKIWKVGIWEKEKPQTLRGHDSWINSISFSPDGKFLASGSSDKTIKIWKVQNWTIIQKLEEHNDFVNSVSFMPDGKYLVSVSSDKINIWKVGSWNLIKTLKGPGKFGYLYSGSFSPDGRYFAIRKGEKSISIFVNEIVDTEKTFKNKPFKLAKYYLVKKNLVFIIDEENNLYRYNLDNEEALGKFAKINKDNLGDYKEIKNLEAYIVDNELILIGNNFYSGSSNCEEHINLLFGSKLEDIKIAKHYRKSLKEVLS